MSVWGDNPEWFDEWLERRALDGKLGGAIQAIAQNGEFRGYEWWDKVDTKGHLAQMALIDYYDRFIE